MARLVESSSWVFFDVLAPEAASGAHVAMSLRTLLPGATIRSAPDRSPSTDGRRPHLLHCRAAFAGVSVEQARQAIDEALQHVESLAGDAASARARIVFGDDGTGRSERAA